MISVLGVDVGGTKVAAGPVDLSGAQLAAPLVVASDATDQAAFLGGLKAALRRALAEFEGLGPTAVGLACAGTVDGSRGVVVTSPNLPLVNVPLAGLLEEELGLPVVLENDGNAAVLSESVAGAAAGLRDVVLLALGTGVGGGLFLNGRIYRGAGGGAGELGHIIVQAGGLVCRCGSRGCLEMYASGQALARYARSRCDSVERDPGRVLSALGEQGRLTGREVARLAQEGHPGALEAVGQLSDWLGIGLVNIANVFNPEMIVVGGGVSQLGELLLHPAREYARKNAMTPGSDTLKVELAMLGNQAGVVGAGLVAWDALRSRRGSRWRRARGSA